MQNSLLKYLQTEYIKNVIHQDQVSFILEIQVQHVLSSTYTSLWLVWRPLCSQISTKGTINVKHMVVPLNRELYNMFFTQKAGRTELDGGRGELN